MLYLWASSPTLNRTAGVCGLLRFSTSLPLLDLLVSLDLASRRTSRLVRKSVGALGTNSGVTDMRPKELRRLWRSAFTRSSSTKSFRLRPKRIGHPVESWNESAWLTIQRTISIIRACQLAIDSAAMFYIKDRELPNLSAGSEKGPD